jgi:hypothetical protein
MGGLGGAWAVGMAITGWRQVRQSGHMPVPASLMAVTGLFVALGIIAEAAPVTARVVTLTAWGLDLAGLLRILPAGLFAEVQTAEQAAQAPVSATSGSGSSSGTGGVVA